jgi:hypothetical protein
MLWAVLLGGVSGAIGAGIASLLIRDRTRHRTAHVIVWAATFAVLTGLGRMYVLPEIRVWEARRAAEQFTNENPVFLAIAARHPEVRTRFSELLADLARRNVSDAEARAAGIAFGQSTIAQYLKEFMATASDDALASFTAVLTDILDDLAARDVDACFAYMFSRPMPPGFAISPADEKRANDAMAEVVHSSSGPRGPVDEARVKTAMQTLLGRLESEHGRDVIATLGNAAHPRRARRRPHGPLRREPSALSHRSRASRRTARPGAPDAARRGRLTLSASVGPVGGSR